MVRFEIRGPQCSAESPSGYLCQEDEGHLPIDLTSWGRAGAVYAHVSTRYRRGEIAGWVGWNDDDDHEYIG